MLILEQCSKSFDGYQYVYSHESFTLGCEMKFGVYVPLIADERALPLLIFLSGRQANEQNFITKSGMQRLASKYGFIVANSDTCPHNNDWSGFYIDSIDENSCQMFSYINDEFYELLIENFNIDIDRIGIFGHEMGGHGALISFFKRPGQYASVSAFSPICNPIACSWCQPIFRKYLSENEQLWKEYDACELVRNYQGPYSTLPILIDQCSETDYNDSLNFIQACTNASFPIQYRQQIGYKNDDYFLLTFLEDHFKYHQNTAQT